jgi:3-phenylpropionate/cinnamic acid dioxygenase small subunit
MACEPTPEGAVRVCLTRAMADDATSRLDGIRDVLARYCQLCDDGRFDEWARLFTDDATFSVMGETRHGPADIQAFIEAGMPPEVRGKHMCANTVIDLDESGASADAATDFVFVGRVAGKLAITQAGRYLDRLVRVGDGWRFASREIVFLGD